MRKAGIWVAAVCLAAVAWGPAAASGFSIYEHGAKASGQAGAWVARADDAAANWYNPAALTRMDGRQFQFGINLITIGSDVEFTSSDPLYGFTSPTTIPMVKNNATPIHLYYAQKVNDRIAWGIGINNPMGLVTEWGTLPITLSHQRAELHTIVVNPNIAFTVNETWSLAFGIDYMYADVKEFSQVIDQSALLGMPPLSVLGASDLTGDGDDWGFNLAAHYQADTWSFGFTYRGALAPEVEGNATFTGINPAVASLFPDGPGTAPLDLPAQAAVGFAWDVDDDWVMEFDISWAGWSSFKTLTIDFANETSVSVEVAPGVFVDVPVVEDISLREDWDDTFAFRLGAAWSMNDKHELRFGGLFDQAPTQESTLRPSIPDSDRTAVTFGYGYKGKKWDFDAYYMPLWFDDSVANDGDPASIAEEGVIDGTYHEFVHLLGVTFNWRF